jgi:hypothetical protein
MPTRMADSAQLTYEEAEKKFELHIGTIAEQCGCKRCTINGTGLSKSSQDSSAGKEKLCLPAVACTIIRLIRELSGIDIRDPKLTLNRGGVDWLYTQQKQRHQRQMQMKKTRTNRKDELYLWHILDFVRIDRGAPEFSRLAIAHILFSGIQRKEDIAPYTSAIEGKGISCF